MRKSFFVIIVLAMMLSFTSLAYAAPQVVLNGQTLDFEVPPAIEGGRTLVPLRAIFEALGTDVQWDGDTQTVTATKNDTEIILVIGGAAYKNGQPVALDVPAKIIDSRTMVPLRFVSEALGCQVSWDGATQTITITSSLGTSTVKVHFIDVGQADSIYISLPDHNDILIDGGNERDGQTVVNYLHSQGVDDIELMIATHPHADHIGGLPFVSSAFKIENTIDNQTDNRQAFTFGSINLQILTGQESWDDLNDSSVVCRLDTGDIEFLFMGDVGFPAEEALSDELDAEVLKVGHHGSRTSTSADLLSEVKPEAAVISVGVGNSYGHPTAETLQRLADAGATIYRTDLSGDIVVITDGKTYSIETRQLVNGVPVKPTPSGVTPADTATKTYVGSVKSDKYHYPSCRYAQSIKPENEIWFADAAEAQTAGYVPCGVCKP